MRGRVAYDGASFVHLSVVLLLLHCITHQQRDGVNPKNRLMRAYLAGTGHGNSPKSLLTEIDGWPVQPPLFGCSVTGAITIAAGRSFCKHYIVFILMVILCRCRAIHERGSALGRDPGRIAAVAIPSCDRSGETRAGAGRTREDEGQDGRTKRTSRPFAPHRCLSIYRSLVSYQVSPVESVGYALATGCLWGRVAVGWQKERGCSVSLQPLNRTPNL